MTPQEIEALKAERDALAAQVEVVQQNLAQCYPHIKSADRKLYFSLGEALQLIEKSLESLPQQCLAEIRAEAGRAGYERGALYWCFNSSDMSVDIEKSANEYAATVRQGGAE